MSGAMEQVSSQAHQTNLIDYTLKARSGWEKNVEVFKYVLSKEHFDLVIGDEAYETGIALKKNPAFKKFPFVWITDFVGMDVMGGGMKEKLAVSLLNRIYAMDDKPKKRVFDLKLLVGELEDVPDKTFGFLLPDRREYARVVFQFVGYIFPFGPVDYADKRLIRIRKSWLKTFSPILGKKSIMPRSL